MNSSFSNSEENTPASKSLNYAGFRIRLVAGLIDLMILLIPFSVVVTFVAVYLKIWNNLFFALRPGQPLPADLLEKGPILVSIGLGVFIFLGWLYFALLESSAWRGTCGKHFLGLYVADERGNPISFWRGTKRFLGGRLLLHVPALGIFYFIVDCLCIAVQERKQAIHDILAGCLVLRESTNEVG